MTSSQILPSSSSPMIEVYIHHHGGYAVVPLYVSISPKEEIMSFSSKRRISWELEEKRRLPSFSGELIIFKVTVEEEGFKIVVNEDNYIFYYQRMDPNQADQISIVGDVLVNAVEISYLEDEEYDDDEDYSKENN